jgi:hypothetical protein
MEHYDVLIVTPGSSMEKKYVVSLMATIKELDSNNISWAYSSFSNSDVAIAREQSVAGVGDPFDFKEFDGPMAGSITYNKIFFIDSDIYWTPEDFLNLYYSDYEFISGVYLQADMVNTTLFRKIPGSNTTGIEVLLKEEIFRRTFIFEVEAVGLGFCCLKQGALEKIKRPWFSHVIKTMPTGGVYMPSEDISFCSKAKDAGIKIFAEPAVLVGHAGKKIDIGWDK